MKNTRPRVEYNCAICGKTCMRTDLQNRVLCGADECKRRYKLNLGIARYHADIEHARKINREERMRERAAKRASQIHICVICAKEYSTTNPRQIYTCGAKECKKRWKNRRFKGKMDTATPQEELRGGCGYVRCIRSNDLYAAGHEYPRNRVVADVRNRYVPREDFRL